MSFAAGLIAGFLFALLAALRLTDLENRVRRAIAKWRGKEDAPAELREAIDERLKEPELGGEDRAMLGGVLGLRDLEIEDVMIHRTKMETLDLERPPAELITAILKSGFTRFPMWSGKPDNIEGILHTKDLLAALQKEGGDASKLDVKSLMQSPWFVPGTRPLADQLKAFLRRKRQLAMVVDEYGELMGLVTLEDILEEIVGEIADEHDSVASGVRQQKDGSYLVDGAVPIRDLNRSLGWALPDDEATTIAGLVIHEARMIPEAGQVFTFHETRFEVLRKRRNQLTQLRAMRLGATIL
jgi:Mg2+/Co2+ transporter CorB